MVMCQDTDYVLLDKPLNNIDTHHAVSMMQLLRRAVDECVFSLVTFSSFHVLLEN